MTEIREPTGPGLAVQPTIGTLPGDDYDPLQSIGVTERPDDALATAPVATTRPEIGAGVGSLQWLRNNRMDDYLVGKAMSDSGVGTLTGAPTLEWSVARSSFRNLTEQPSGWPVPMRQPGPIDLAKPGEPVRMGQMSLDLIDPFTTMDMGANFGLPEGMGQDLFAYFNARDIDWLGWDIPSRLLDYGVAVPLAWLAGPLGLEDEVFAHLGKEREENRWYRFQQSPEYWEWVARATDEDMHGQARMVAQKTWGGDRSKLAEEALLRQFDLDRDKTLGLSSGDKRWDFMAKWRAFEMHYGLEGRDSATSPGAIETGVLAMPADPADREAWLQSRLDAIMAAGSETGMRQSRAEVERWLRTGSRDAIFSPVDQISHAVGHFQSWLLPMVGTEVAEMSGSDPFIDALWESMSPEERQGVLGNAAMSTMATDMATAVLVALPFAFAGAAGAGASTAAQVGLRAYNATLNISKVALAYSFTTTAAHVGLEWASPAYAAGLGRTIDAARPISSLPVAGVANALGIFATGTWGAYTAAQGLKSGARAIGTRGVPGLMGMAEAPMVRYGFGSAGSSVGRLRRSLGFQPEFVETVIKGRWLNYIANHDLRQLLKTYAMASGNTPTGYAPFDLLPTPEARATAMAEVFDRWSPDEAAELAVKLRAAAEQDPALLLKWGLRDREGRWFPLRDPHEQLKSVRRVARSMENDIAQQFAQSQLGRFGGTPESIRAAIVGTLKRIHRDYPDVAPGIGSMDEVALNSRLGNDLERLQRAANFYHAAEFDLNNGVLHEVAKGSDEADRIHLMRADTLTRGHVTQEVIDTLRVGDDAATALMEQLRVRFPFVAELMARKPGVTPVRLADDLESARPALPEKRALPDPASPTYGDPLNMFHVKLDADGLWTLGWKPYRDSVVPLDDDLFMAVLPNGTVQIPPAWAGPRAAYTDPSQVPFGGPWRRAQPGETFRKGDTHFVLTLHDGVYVDREAIIKRPSAQQAPVSAATMALPAHTKASLAVTNSDQTRTLTGDGWVLKNPPASELTRTGQVLHGGQQSHEVWADANGRRWLFKGGRGNPAGSAKEHRVIGEWSAGRLYAAMGLEGASVLPYSWKNSADEVIDGTIQVVYESATPLTVYDLADTMDNVLTSAQQEAVWGHYIIDWLVSQHDTNKGSFFILMNGEIAGIDKGQLGKHFMDQDWPPRLDFDPNDTEYIRPDGTRMGAGVGEYTFTRALREATAAGWVPDWGRLEPTFRRLESMSQAEFMDIIRPWAEARVKEGVDSDVFVLIDELVNRRQTIRVEFAKLFNNDLNTNAIMTRYSDQALAVQSFRAGQPMSWDIPGSTVPVENRRINLEDHIVNSVDAHPVPEPDGAAVTRAGVAILDETGNIWFVAPANNFGGYQAVIPKGHINPGESIQASAVREVAEETGFITSLDSFLMDYTDPTSGVVTRYYVGRRVSGGPKFADAHETGSVFYGPPSLAKAMAGQMFGGGVNQREIDVIDALIDWQATGASPWTTQNVPAAVAPGPPGTAAPALPGAQSPNMRRSYIRYSTLNDGTVVPAPWIDDAMSSPGDLALGQRTWLGAKMDSVFRGWRTWRLAHYQKAMTFRRLDTEYQGITLAQIDVFVERLDELAEQYRVPVQFIGNLTSRPFHSAPLIGSTIADKVAAAAIETFGPRMLRKNGTAIDTVMAPWKDIIVKSFRQPFRLNMSSGFTSYMYSLPGGWLPALIGQGIWPNLKFTLSPLFKAGEYAESAMYNWMRGVFMSDDALRVFEPHMGLPSDWLRGEYGMSPYLTGMGTSRALAMHAGVGSSNAPQRHYRGAAGAALVDPTMQSGLAQMKRAAARAAYVEANTTHYPSAGLASLEDYITGDAIRDPELWPKALPKETPEALLPHWTDPSGASMVSHYVPEQDARLLRQSGIGGPPGAGRIAPDSTRQAADEAFGVGAMSEFGYENIDQLLAAKPLTHYAGDRWLDRLDLEGPHASVAKYSRFSDPVRPAIEAEVKQGPSGTFVEWAGNQGSISSAEGRYLMYTALYNEQGSWYSFSSGPGGGNLILNKRRVMDRALITHGDRINMGYDFATWGMSGHGLLQRERSSTTERLLSMGPDDTYGEALRARGPRNEVAVYGDIGWDDVEAVVFAEQEGMDAFLAKVNAASPEARQRVSHIELIVRGGNDQDQLLTDYMWNHSGLADWKDKKPLPPDPGDYLRIYGIDNLPTWKAEPALRASRERLTQEGFGSSWTPSFGMLDDVSSGIREQQGRLADIQPRVAEEVLESRTPQHKQRVREQQEFLAQMHAIYDDLLALKETGGLRYTTIGSAGAAWRNAANELSVAERDVFDGMKKPFDRGTVTVDEFHQAVAAYDWQSVSPETVAALVNGLRDEATLGGIADAWESVASYANISPHRNGSIIRNAQEAYASSVEVTDLRDGHPFTVERLDIEPAGLTSQFDDVHALNTLRALHDRFGQALTEPRQRAGSSPAFAEVRKDLVPMAFVSEVHRRSREALGYDPGVPVIQAYVRGFDPDVLMDGPVRKAGEMEIVITVAPADRIDLGIELAVVEKIWRETALPSKGFVPHVTHGYMGWDEVRQGVTLGADLDAWASTLPDGTPHTDFGQPVAPVRFESSFDHQGLAYGRIENTTTVIFDPSDIKTQVGPGYKAFHRHRDWSMFADTTGHQLSPMIRTFHPTLVDDALRNTWAYARQHPEQQWTVNLDGRVATLEFDQMLGGLKRAWYLGEVPDNVLIINGATGDVFDTAWFQREFGAPPTMTTKKQPRGLEDVPGSEEHFSAQYLKRLALLAGVDEAELMAGRLQSILPHGGTPQQRQWRRIIASWMDPIPWKEHQMDKLTASLQSKVLIDLMDEIGHPARKVFTELGVPDDQVAAFLLEDRQLLNRWLTTGRREDFDALLGHTEKYMDTPTMRVTEEIDDVEEFTVNPYEHEFVDGGAEPVLEPNLYWHLTPQMRAIAQHMGGGSEAAVGANTYLRMGLPSYAFPLQYNLPEYAGDLLGNIDVVLDRAELVAALRGFAERQMLKEPTIVYRGLPAEAMPDTEVGAVVDWSEEAAIFTASDEARAAGYGTMTARMHLPWGSLLTEDEMGDFLLPSQKFHVIGREVVDGRLRVDLAPGAGTGETLLTQQRSVKRTVTTTQPVDSTRGRRLREDVLDPLYGSDDYQTLTQLWRMGLKASQDEAFSTHFFNPYRSTLERSFNHPVFGVYPLSWALKAAREWARFLFDNRVLGNGNIRLGMAPAVAISEYNRQLSVLAAQYGGDLGYMLGHRSGLGNMMMIASLIMPGDWSSIPFPMSRTIRELMRGNLDPSSHFEANMGSGIARDLRLFFDGGQELTRALAGAVTGPPAASDIPSDMGYTVRGSDLSPAYDYRLDAQEK